MNIKLSLRNDTNVMVIFFFQSYGYPFLYDISHPYLVVKIRCCKTIVSEFYSHSKLHASYGYRRSNLVR